MFATAAKRRLWFMQKAAVALMRKTPKTEFVSQFSYVR